MSCLERCGEQASVLLIIIESITLHSCPEEQREAVRQLVYLVLIRDVSTSQRQPDAEIRDQGPVRLFSGRS